MAVLIAGAWPYANGELHLGHLSSLLPGDILARYFRQKGEEVLYVSGSDCNGTPISIRARQEAVSTQIIADRYHCSFKRCFDKLGFTFDCYTRTDTPLHHEIVQHLFQKLYDHRYIYHKKVKQTYCEYCSRFLPDRYVEGKCPHCGADARGDQCEHCSTILDPLELIDRKCKICGRTPTERETEHLYFSLSHFQEVLEQYEGDAEKQHAWRENAINLTKRYLKEGLQDRAVTRDLPNGVPVPIKGFEDKKIYVWIEAVSGYYSASKQWQKETGKDVSRFWNEDTVSYYVQGKDNIPFHTIIWPAVLLGSDIRSLPTHIVSNEYLTLEKKKLSTSKNWAVWVPDLIARYHPDTIRYFLTINAPETHDADFSWREFINSHNSELLGAYGNFVNRTLKFIEKIENFVSSTSIADQEVQDKINLLYAETGRLIESAHIKKALEKIFDFVRYCNKYFDVHEPWKLLEEDKDTCCRILNTCQIMIANLAQLLAPFLPFSSQEVQKMLGLGHLTWQPIVRLETKTMSVHPLFQRIERSQIDTEIDRLYNGIKR